VRAPRLWLIAGPNGSGKSTFASSGRLQRLEQTPEDPAPLEIINPDKIARVLERRGLSGAPLEAARQADALMLELIAARRSFARETALSTDRLRPVIRTARAEGFRICIAYLLLRRPELNIERVRQRTAQGGHDVPAEKIVARWRRAIALMPSFAAEADVFALWDNSRVGEPELLAARVDTGWWLDPRCSLLAQAEYAAPELRAALHKLEKLARAE
jgi:predicted ABC-type ATPase